MANVEAAPNDTGPRYAPDDPTLPKPWKGLIDGSTSVTYYWNPETNVTQYEKPVPADITSQPAPQPAMQHGQATQVSQYQQYMNQASQQQGQLQGSVAGHVAQQQGQLQGSVAGHVAQQQAAQMPPTGQQGSQMGGFQQHYAQFGQTMPHGGSQMVQPRPYGAQMLQSTGSQLPPQHSIQHTPPMGSQQAPQPQGPQGGQSQGQGHHFGTQQMPYGNYHFGPQGMPQGSPFVPQHENAQRIPPHDDSEFNKVKQAEFSMPLGEQSGRVVGQGPPSMNVSNHGVHASPVSGQSQSFGMHQPASSVKMQDGGNDVIHGGAYRNQINQSSMHPQQHAQPPVVASKMGYEDNQQLRAGGRYHPYSNNEAPIMAAQHPKLAAIPSVRNHQDMMTGGFPPQNGPSAHDNTLNTMAPHGLHNMYNHANDVLPGPNHPMSRAPPMMPGSADVMNMSSADAYRQQHEVTATGDNVPAPFMTFEATGFPPEILREVRYLLRWGAYVVRCTAIPLKAAQWIFGAFIHPYHSSL